MKQSIAIIACLLFISKSVFAVDPDLDWKTIESNYLYVHYADGNKAMAEKKEKGCVTVKEDKGKTSETRWQNNLMKIKESILNRQ